MTIIKNLDLRNFEFWSGAKNHSFTNDELTELENHLEELYPDGIEETKVNDIFWFDEEFLCECLGLDYENEYLER